MADPDTDTLRKLAPCWSLAGDERLLTILQNTHQKLVARCQEANSQLEQMATTLDDASITLQNVNNQFMALSSSQFIESRVYDDDADVVTDAPTTKESPKPSPPDELSIIKRSIAVIESNHEEITILHDSDTESDSDDDVPDRLVMKPKDQYAGRPLPYIIGSEPWKNKWHAGLLPEDSDTDSSTSKPDRESDQYSLSEPEEFEPQKVQGSMPVPQHRKISDTSSELPSEVTPTSIAKPTPSDVASEIARRLGGALPTPRVEPAPEYDEPAKPTVRKIYKPQEPVASTIFPDEPPPLEEQSDSETDIFADLHRNQPYKQTYDRQYVTDELFGDDNTDDEGGDIFSDFANQPHVTKPTSLFDAGPKPHMFDRTTGPTQQRLPEQRVEQPKQEQTSKDNSPDVDEKVGAGVKKPVGGISLFGTNKGAESIGAAILRRNRRKSSTSGDESANDTPEPPPLEKEQPAKKEKDIFDDLFAKSEAKKVKPKTDIVKDIRHEIQKKKEEKIRKEPPKAVDLFSDNLFDDIDDIFTTPVVKTSTDNKKSIFDDDDDLFSEIAEPKVVKQDAKSNADIKKSLFDSDDDLFSEKIVGEKPSISSKPEPTSKISENPTDAKPTEIAKVTNKTTSIFDDDEDNIFSNISTSKVNNVNKVQNVTMNTGTSNLTKNIETPKKVFNSPSLFDDDDDESDLFVEKPSKTASIAKNDSVTKVSVETPSKTEVNITTQISETNINVTISSPEIVKDATSEVVKTRVEIETNAVSLPSNTIKADEKESISKVNNVIKEESEIRENKVNNDIHKTVEISERKVTDIVNEPVKENIETNNLHENKSASTIQKMLEDDNDKTSEDDFSDQDFDDEPIQETKHNQNRKINTIPEVKDIESNKNMNSIFDDRALKEDIFASPNNIPNNDKSDFTDEPPPFNEPDFANAKNVDNSETNIDDKKEIIASADIFTDIVTEPPAFEKPKEPKKSKNVNALFDDDSDDEALFFKKEVPISDEKPEDFNIKQDRLFGLFTDEPPDDDFTKIDDDLDDDLFSTLPKPKIPGEKLPRTGQFDDLPIPDDLPIFNDTPIRDEIPIPDEIPKPPEIPLPGSMAYNKPTSYDIPKPIVNEEIRNSTAVAQLENIIKSENSTTPVAKSNEDTDDIFKLPASEINNSQPVKKSTSIFDDDDDMFKKSSSITNNVADKQNTILDDDEELFKSLPVQLPQQKAVATKNEDIDYRSDEELFKSLPIIEKSSKETPKPSLTNKDIFKSPLQRSNSTNSDLKQEPKKVGKLKVGLNINVNALLPGASPKKVKPIDSPDGQSSSIVEVENDDPKLIKSVSFEGKPDSEVLDNKLSKERPRIQVKRRPSTRKARREAVRKSGIDFGDDSTDNSSSIDDPPKSETEIKNIDVVDSKDTIPKAQENIEPPQVESYIAPIKPETEEKVDILSKVAPERQPVKSNSTTKIVYILNDEDIFNTSALETTETKHDLDASQVETNIAKNADVSLAKNPEILDQNLGSSTGISTLGNAYKTVKVDDSKNAAKSLFGDDINADNDDELFKNKKPVVKSKIFDSDSEEELFGNSKKVEKVMKVDEVMKVDKKVVKTVKGSLFGDEDDDDDLFGVKTKKNAEAQPLPSRSTASVKETAKSTQPVFEDPLSIFGDD